MKPPIDFYFDFSSPYGFLASQRIEALAARHGRSVAWHPVLLGVVFRQTGVLPLTEVPIKGAYTRHDVSRTARFHGLEPFRWPPRFPIPTQAAARIVLWARARDPALATKLVHALFRAYFTEHRDISDPEVAADVAAGAGADRALARAAVDDDAVKESLKQEVAAAIEAGVFGSPLVVADGEPFWGLDRFDQLDRWLATGGF